MNVISAQSLVLEMGAWVVVAIALAVAVTYLFSRKVRARFPGGDGRYLAALSIQAAGFMLPIPIVLVWLFGAPIWPGLDALLAVCAGFIVVVLLRLAPLTGPLLQDLARTRLQVRLEPMGGEV